jgi:hypothetical protein
VRVGRPLESDVARGSRANTSWWITAGTQSETNEGECLVISGVIVALRTSVYKIKE